MWRSLVVALAGSLLWRGWVGGTLDEPAGESPVENGRISFIVGEYGGGMKGIKVAVAEPDGSGVRTLIDGVPQYLTGGWSADGSSIVLSRDPAGTPDTDIGIWKIGVDGSGLEQLTEGAADLDAQWSPDGNRILFLRSSHDGDLLCDGRICRDAAPRSSSWMRMGPTFDD